MATARAGDRLLVLDVRKPEAFEASGAMLQGAAWRDPAGANRWGLDLPNRTPVVVYCVHGHEVSQGVGAALRDIGVNVRVLKGGFESWRQAGGPTVPTARNRT